MLQKQQRLNAREIRHVLRYGKTIRCNGVTIRYVHADVVKCGVVIPKKGGVTAVERNRVRRVVYTFCGNVRATLLPLHIVVFLKIRHGEIFNTDDICGAFAQLERK